MTSYNLMVFCGGALFILLYAPTVCRAFFFFSDAASIECDGLLQGRLAFAYRCSSKHALHVSAPLGHMPTDAFFRDALLSIVQCQ